MELKIFHPKPSPICHWWGVQISRCHWWVMPSLWMELCQFLFHRNPFNGSGGTPEWKILSKYVLRGLESCCPLNPPPPLTIIIVLEVNRWIPNDYNLNMNLLFDDEIEILKGVASTFVIRFVELALRLTILILFHNLQTTCLASNLIIIGC